MGGRKMKAKKQNVIIKGCCAFAVVAFPLIFAMYRVDGEVDYTKGYAAIITAALLVSIAQGGVYIWYERRKSQITQGEKEISEKTFIKIFSAVLELWTLILTGVLMSSVLYIIGWNENLPYKIWAAAVIAGLVLSAAAIGIISIKKHRKEYKQ